MTLLEMKFRQKELLVELRVLTETLNHFEATERSRGNPLAIAGLPPSEWRLPADIETLYDLHWVLAQEEYIICDCIEEITHEIEGRAFATVLETDTNPS